MPAGLLAVLLEDKGPSLSLLTYPAIELSPGKGLLLTSCLSSHPWDVARQPYLFCFGPFHGLAICRVGES